jgi:hypothetical protein
MCFASSADPEPIQKPAEYADPQVQASRTDSNRRNRAAAGSQSTILSALMAPIGGQGGGASGAQAKTMLGQ